MGPPRWKMPLMCWELRKAVEKWATPQKRWKIHRVVKKSVVQKEHLKKHMKSDGFKIYFGESLFQHIDNNLGKNWLDVLKNTVKIPVKMPKILKIQVKYW